MDTDAIIIDVRLLLITDGVPNRDPEFGDGSSMISFEIIKCLPPEIVLTLVVLGSAHEIPPEISARCERIVTFGKRSHRSALIRSLFTRLQVSAEERSVPATRARIRDLSAESDVTLLHGPHIPFAARYVRGPMVIQAVDPWSMRMEMEARFSPGLLGVYRGFKARRVLALERSIPGRARLLTVGREDAARWSEQLHRTLRGIANGVDQTVRARRREGGPVVCFIGSLSYPPNIESAAILVKEIAPLVWRELPEARFVIAGRQPDPAVTDNLIGPRVDVLPNVPSMAGVLNSADVAVFPDREGLGIRNSAREALAAGIPVVATKAAAREVEERASLSVAEEPAEIAARVVSILRAVHSPTQRPVSDPVPERTWNTATTEYLDELDLARSS